MATTHDQGYPNFMKDTGNWVIGGTLDVNGRADAATITLAAPSGSNRDITLQLQDALGNDVTEIQSVKIHVFADAAGADWATTGGSTGIVDNGAGSLLALVAKKIFAARSDATGALALRWTDTGSEVAFLGIELPSGRVLLSDALTI